MKKVVYTHAYERNSAVVVNLKGLGIRLELRDRANRRARAIGLGIALVRISQLILIPDTSS